MNILGNFVTLRAIELDDQEFLLFAINNNELEVMTAGKSFPVSYKDQVNWFNNLKNDKHNLRLIISTEEFGAVGLINLINIDYINRYAYIGIKLFDKNIYGKGIGTDALMAITRYVFEELQLNRLESGIMEYNEASKKIFLEKCGWTLEGTKRETYFTKNKYYDELVLSILKEEYINLIQNNNYWK